MVVEFWPKTGYEWAARSPLVLVGAETLLILAAAVATAAVLILKKRRTN